MHPEQNNQPINQDTPQQPYSAVPDPQYQQPQEPLASGSGGALADPASESTAKKKALIVASVLGLSFLLGGGIGALVMNQNKDESGQGATLAPL